VHLHPEDLAELGLVPGDLVEIESDHGLVHAFASSDPSTSPGVVSMTHCYGDLPGRDDDPAAYGANPARLLSHTVGVQAINAMPQMTAVPVTLRRP